MKPINIHFMHWWFKYLFVGMTLYPFILWGCKRSERDPVHYNHELIHWTQQRERYVILFYIRYIYEHIKLSILLGKQNEKFIKPKNAYYKRYTRISFEWEAFQNESDLNYLAKRERNAWRKYKYYLLNDPIL